MRPGDQEVHSCTFNSLAPNHSPQRTGQYLKQETLSTYQRQGKECVKSPVAVKNMFEPIAENV